MSKTPEKVIEKFLKELKILEKEDKIKLKKGLSVGNILKNIESEDVRNEPIKYFIENATLEKENEDISLVDLLYAFNGYSSEKLSRNKFVQAIKSMSMYEVGLEKSNDRKILCLRNRTWNENFQ